jgi:hypothetical protein
MRFCLTGRGTIGSDFVKNQDRLAGTGFAGTGFAGTGFAGTGFAGTGFAGTGFKGNQRPPRSV